MSDTSKRPWTIELEQYRPNRQNITIVSARGVVMRCGDTSMPGAMEDAELTIRAVNSFDEIVSLLEQLEAHHIEQNARKGRDESRSTTLRLVRAALAKAGKV